MLLQSDYNLDEHSDLTFSSKTNHHPWPPQNMHGFTACTESVPNTSTLECSVDPTECWGQTFQASRSCVTSHLAPVKSVRLLRDVFSKLGIWRNLIGDRDVPFATKRCSDKMQFDKSGCDTPTSAEKLCFSHAVETFACGCAALQRPVIVQLGCRAIFTLDPVTMPPSDTMTM